MDKQEQVTPAMLRDLLEYDPGLGLMKWNPRSRGAFSDKRSFSTWTSRYAGMPAFQSKNEHGYPIGRIMGFNFKAHRVAWAIAYGEWPAGEIDHINHDRSDFRLANLRTVTVTENRRNQSLSIKNKSGAMGVWFAAHAKKWTAQIMVEGKGRHLGYFTTFDEAVAARAEANVRFGFHENHGMAA